MADIRRPTDAGGETFFDQARNGQISFCNPTAQEDGLPFISLLKVATGDPPEVTRIYGRIAREGQL